MPSPRVVRERDHFVPQICMSEYPPGPVTFHAAELRSEVLEKRITIVMLRINGVVFLFFYRTNFYSLLLLLVRHTSISS